MRLTLMTYNIRVGVESDMAEVAASIRAAGVPDVLAMQEIGVRWNMGECVDQPAVIADALGLPYHTFAGALTDPCGGQFGVALVSRYPLTDVSVEKLPKDRDEQRVLLSARLESPVPIRVLNTHLSVFEEERLLQAQRLGRVAATSVEPVVVIGDLNDRPGTPVIDAARGALLDCFDVTGEGPEETFSVADPHRRIDYVFCGSPICPVGTARVERNARASDHFPLIALVEHP